MFPVLVSIATVAVTQPSCPGRMDAVQGLLVALIWIIIGAIDISHARRP